MSPRPGSLTALIGALTLLFAPAALAGHGPDLKTTVTASPNPVAAGQYITLQLIVDNISHDPAGNVVAKAFVPSGTQFVHATSGCSLNVATVECPLGTLGPNANEVLQVVLRLTNFSFAGTLQTFVTAHQSTTDADPSNDGDSDNVTVYNNSHDHQQVVSKSEEHFSLPPLSGIQSYKLECPKSGDIMLDGSVRIDNVDQDTGDLKSVSVLAQYPEGNGYRFKLVNYATGQAQGKLFGTCISGTTQGANYNNTDHTHDVQVGAVRSETISVTAGNHYDTKVSCGAGPADYVFAAAPGYGVSGAEGTLNYSLPGYDANGRPAWDFGFNATQSGTVSFFIRCVNRYLSTELGHTHEQWLSSPDKYVSVSPNAPAGGTFDIDCSDEAKGIVAGFGLEDPIYMLGHDPQPKRRSFKLLNDGGSNKEARLLLICVGDRTGTDPPPPVAPAAVGPVAKASDGGDRVAVKVSCPAGGCGGTVALVASASGARAAAAAAKVIGRGAFKSTGKDRVKAKVRIAKAYRGAVRSGRISSVTAVVRNHDGKVVKRQRLRIS